MEVIKLNECKFRRRLDMVQREKEDLVKPLEVKKEALFLATRSSDDQDSSINNRGNSDNFSVKQHEKVWPRMLGRLVQETAVQEIVQAGLSSTGNDEDSNNFQAGQQVVM